MQEAIGKELRIIRIRKKLELENVAEDLKINQETLRRYETATTGLSIEKLESLLNYYNIDSTIFFKNVCEDMHNREN